MHGRIRRPRGYRGLMERMARRVGVNLGRNLVEGRIPIETIEHMMGHCALCDSEARCRADLKRGKFEGGEPPEYCLNRKLLIALAEAKDEEDAD